MYSMTGYGRAEYSENAINLVVELKSVNNRIFDFSAKMPRAFICFEDKIRKTVAEFIKRGRIELFVNFSDHREKSASINADLARAAEYYNAAKSIAESLDLPNDYTVSYLMKCSDVIADDFSFDATEFEEILISTVKAACEKFNEMRKTEGEKLVSDMLLRMQQIREITENIALRAPFVAAEYKERLKARIIEALDGVKYDETRLLNEVAFYTDKVNIDEELTRLRSHISQFCTIVNTIGSGKKLDFLMQEFNREANTICSKSNDLKVTEFGLSLKNEIEKVREQVQNLE
ncbi:MAG: YicC family protein [Clostridia bacterium]|nr:YicC family protein [Clostridia bacterium]